MAASAIIDTHVHIFARDLPIAADSRYAPGYDAPAIMLASAMGSAEVGRAVLVQPSFLGVDNSYLLAAIKAEPERYSGIAVVRPDMSAAGLAALKAGGIHGVRLNLIGRPVPDFDGDHAGLLAGLAKNGMALQLQAEGAQWPAMQRFLERATLPVIIDHFGRTPPADATGGFAALCSAARGNSMIWFKFSAPYRFAPGAAAECVAAILDICGPERILWGSDWPATQHEGQHSYAQTLAWLSQWVPAPADRLRILQDNPRRLFALP